MDIHCLKCHEPWDMVHMREDAILDCVELHDCAAPGRAPRFRVSEERAKEFARNPTFTKPIRKAFKSVGWTFGSSIYIIKHCPCCKDGKPTKNTAGAELLYELLGQAEEHDGFVTRLSDIGPRIGEY